MQEHVCEGLRGLSQKLYTRLAKPRRFVPDNAPVTSDSYQGMSTISQLPHTMQEHVCEGLRGLNQQLHQKVKLLLNKVSFFIGAWGSGFGF